MSKQKKAEEIAFNRKYSRFKVQIFFSQRMAITHYGQERYHCTVAQIRFKHAPVVILNREAGLQDCIARIELCEKLYGAYQTALIYDRRRDTRKADGTMEIGKEIMKYVNGQLVEWELVEFTDKNKIIICDVIYKTHSTGNYFILKPKEDPNAVSIDFKKEVADALASKSSNTSNK